MSSVYYFFWDAVYIKGYSCSVFNVGVEQIVQHSGILYR